MAGNSVDLRGHPGLRRELGFVAPGRLAQAVALLRTQGITADRNPSLYRRELRNFADFEAGAIADQAGSANLAEQQKAIDSAKAGSSVSGSVGGGGSMSGSTSSGSGGSMSGGSGSGGSQSSYRPRRYSNGNNWQTDFHSPFTYGSLGSRSTFGSLYRPIR